MFDHLCLSAIETIQWFADLSHDKRLDSLRELLKEYESLRETGVIIAPPPQLGSKQLHDELIEKAISTPTSSKIYDMFKEMSPQLREDIYHDARMRISRRAASRLAAETGWDVVVLGLRCDDSPIFEPGPDAVAQIVLKSIPIPEEQTPWEDILEFREDIEARGHFYRLKSWMNSLVSAGHSPHEVEDELRELLFEYENFMKIHRMKFNLGLLETIVTTSAEVAEGLVKFKWSKAAKSLFSLKHRHIDLLDAERQAPGRQVAYILDTRQRFGSTL